MNQYPSQEHSIKQVKDFFLEGESPDLVLEKLERSHIAKSYVKNLQAVRRHMSVMPAAEAIITVMMADYAFAHETQKLVRMTRRELNPASPDSGEARMAVHLLNSSAFSILNIPLYVRYPKKSGDATAPLRWEVVPANRSKWSYKKPAKCISLIESKGIPLPTPRHLYILEILMAIFVRNWNTSGVLTFSVDDLVITSGSVLKYLCKQVVEEAILRYRRHTIEVVDSIGESSRISTYSIIRNITKYSGNPDQNMTNSRFTSKNCYYRVVFDKEVVQDLKVDSNRTIFIELFRYLTPDSFTVVRHYYCNEEIATNKFVWCSYEQLSISLQWSGSMNYFKKWLVKQMDILMGASLLEQVIFNEISVGVQFAQFCLAKKRPQCFA